MDSGKNQRSLSGFTILELLIATTILSIIVFVLFSAISQTSAIWRRSSDKIESFQGSRLAFDLITHNLSQATLNTYLDYDNTNNPTRFLRKSELKFRSEVAGADFPGTEGTGQGVFFQAPLGYATNVSQTGMESLLNTCGYYVAFTTNSSVPAHANAARNIYRYRLMEVLVPTDANGIYKGTGNTWFSAYTNLAVPVADNVIALIVRPRDPGSAETDLPNKQYAYDTTDCATNDPQPVNANQLPPLVELTLVAIDELSAKRLESGLTAPAAITGALLGKFSDPAKYQQDLDGLVASLAAARINYRVFSTEVPIRESKWTK